MCVCVHVCVCVCVSECVCVCVCVWGGGGGGGLVVSLSHSNSSVYERLHGMCNHSIPYQYGFSVVTVTHKVECDDFLNTCFEPQRHYHSQTEIAEPSGQEHGQEEPMKILLLFHWVCN